MEGTWMEEVNGPREAGLILAAWMIKYLTMVINKNKTDGHILHPD